MSRTLPSRRRRPVIAAVLIVLGLATLTAVAAAPAGAQTGPGTTADSSSTDAGFGRVRGRVEGERPARPGDGRHHLPHGHRRPDPGGAGARPADQHHRGGGVRRRLPRPAEPARRRRRCRWTCGWGPAARPSPARGRSWWAWPATWAWRPAPGSATRGPCVTASTTSTPSASPCSPTARSARGRPRTAASPPATRPPSATSSSTARASRAARRPRTARPAACRSPRSSSTSCRSSPSCSTPSPARRWPTCC